MSHSLEAAERKEMEDTKQIEVAGDLTWTPEEEKKLVRKIDLFLLPTIWLMYLLSYMDRTKYVTPPLPISTPFVNKTSASATQRSRVWRRTSNSLRTNIPSL